eukprot:TRINITY_DN9529_c0_g1_i3.p1 TRINITY_DN9529_c0_g1~~TRINITY_DN9529_c0_g1_i3.p1  ORF type:complete len:109 (+),score=9.86 TRINITY_DN9529_c0_g1_i3:538-864(+)
MSHDLVKADHLTRQVTEECCSHLHFSNSKIQSHKTSRSGVLTVTAGCFFDISHAYKREKSTLQLYSGYFEVAEISDRKQDGGDQIYMLPHHCTEHEVFQEKWPSSALL